MNCNMEVTYAVDFRSGKSADRQPRDVEAAGISISRIARLMALAIRFEGLVKDGTVRDYADLARRGHVTRARMTQIMKPHPRQLLLPQLSRPAGRQCVRVQRLAITTIDDQIKIGPLLTVNISAGTLIGLLPLEVGPKKGG